jgi:hypothetical protein
MARVKYGHLIAEARGKLNGSVFSRNTYGAYMRQKVSPIQPRTARQQEVRQRMAQIASQWRELTQTQRDGWNSLAQQVTRINVFGDNVPLSGFNLYGKLNRNILEAGGTLLSDAPDIVIPDAPTLGAMTFDTAAGTFSIAFSPAPVPANTAYIINATTDLSAGISFAGGKLRQISVLPAATASPYAAFTDWTNKFGSATAGKKVFVEIYAVNLNTGFASQRSSGYVITT